MTAVPSKESLILACENVLTCGQGLTEGFRELLQTTVSALKGNETPELQKAINTWGAILREPNLPPTMNQYAIAAVMHLQRLKR